METYTIQEAWARACEHDSIPVESKFVVFSENNPWAVKYNKAMAMCYGERRIQEVR